MDIRTSAAVGYGYGGLVPVQQVASAQRQRQQIEPVDPVEASRERAHKREQAERILQGELINRGREQQAATTSDYLRGNVYDAEQFLRSQQHRVKRDPEQAYSQSRMAMNAYQSHRQETINPNASRGNGVDYFI